MKNLPVLPIKNTVILPGAAFPLRIGRPQSIAAVEQALKRGQLVIAVSQKAETPEASDAAITAEHLFSTGTLSKIEKVRGNAKSGYQILLRGISRYRINEYAEQDGYISAMGDEWKDVSDSDP